MFENVSSEQAIICYGVVLVIAYLVIKTIFKSRKIIKICVLVGAICLFFFGGELINLNFLPKETLDVVDDVKAKLVETVGSSDSIKVDKGTVYVLVGERWLDLSDISVIGNFVSDNTISYDGEEIYLGHSGVYNTFKVLQDFGLLKGGND